MSTSSSRFRRLRDDFEHYAFMSPRRIQVATAANTATVNMTAMIQVKQGPDTSTTFRYRIATLSSGNDEAIAGIMAGVEANLPKDTMMQDWEKDFSLQSSWKDKAVILAAWSEAIATAGKRLGATDKSLTISDNHESTFRDQLVKAHRIVSDDTPKSAASLHSKLMQDQLSSLCILVAPPVIFEGSSPTRQQGSSNSSIAPTPTSKKLWKFPCVSLSTDERGMVLNSLTHTQGFKPENDPVAVNCWIPNAADSIAGWREGIVSNESPRILAALESFRESLIEAASSTLVQYDLHYVNTSEFGPYVSNTETWLIDID
ncbi:hypothetical protein JCM24511_05427 [Saitozyma sp. JCM 24511]|nr:hypothetical protein JCM24511_05427 [Saitozyma sp. JCM 24511]